MAPNLLTVEKRMRRVYEFGRLRYAAFWSVPLLLLGALAVWMGNRPAMVASVAVMLVVAGALFLWRGQEAERAVLPGVVAGLIPFACAHCARLWGHACTEAGCFSLCIPACIAGGLVAGFIIARASRHAQMAGRFWTYAAILTFLTGTLGCSCTGYGSVLGLLAGLTVWALPIFVRSTTRPS